MLYESRECTVGVYMERMRLSPGLCSKNDWPSTELQVAVAPLHLRVSFHTGLPPFSPPTPRPIPPSLSLFLSFSSPPPPFIPRPQH